jgi:hypothetical protein
LERCYPYIDEINNLSHNNDNLDIIHKLIKDLVNYNNNSIDNTLDIDNIDIKCIDSTIDINNKDIDNKVVQEIDRVTDYEWEGVAIGVLLMIKYMNDFINESNSFKNEISLDNNKREAFILNFITFFIPKLLNHYEPRVRNLSVKLGIYLFIYLYIYLSIYLSIYLFVYYITSSLSNYLTIYLSIYLSIY